jgi:hypothetical protein
MILVTVKLLHMIKSTAFVSEYLMRRIEEGSGFVYNLDREGCSQISSYGAFANDRLIEKKYFWNWM